jgi:hypothetical protein
MRPKGTGEFNFAEELRKTMDRINEDHPVIETRYFVYEIKPPGRYTYDNGHGQAEYDWEGERVVDKMGPYTSRFNAREVMDKLEPESGNRLAIMKQELRAEKPRWWSPKEVSADS